MIYLDNAATTNKKPCAVLKAVISELKNSANPGRSSHFLGVKSLDKILKTREILARLFKLSHPENFILTPNATYGLNFVIKGYLKPYDHCITTSMEHNSVIRPLNSIKNLDITFVRGDKFGFISPDSIVEHIKENTKLIIINHASNVNGIIQDVETIAKKVAPFNIPILIDASQTAGILDTDWSLFSFIAFPGHKSLYGPQGTGAVYIKPGMELETIIEGGTGSNSQLTTNPLELPDRFESGTLNTPGFCGLYEGVNFILNEGTDAILKYEHYLCYNLLCNLYNMENITVYSPFDINKINNTICFNINGKDSSTVAEILNSKFNIATRPGFHCAYPAHETLGTKNQGSVRVSVSYFNTISEINYFVDSIYKIRTSV
ncbi:MAG: aminotransferase class V-fold PLP-dependent enzyme [Clostridia bacterium]|nr:aminotransferase class V-fold PLP-dependent enzyme [Clostridia bacterium]